MPHNFDQVIDRRNTNSISRDGFRPYLLGDFPDLVLPCSDDDTISMWVADMAFASAPAAIDAMSDRLEHPIFGYTAVFDTTLPDAFAQWCSTRYGWTPAAEHIVTSPGVVPALYELVGQIVEPDQKVLTLTPAYAYFDRAPTHHGRELVTCGLRKSGDGTFSLDWNDFEAKVSDPAMRLFFLCHPHNPVGRVWTDDELTRMAEICFAHDVVVVSDEIHCDLLRSGLTHTPLAKLFPQSDQIITCMSASKTFNLAGLGLAHVVIPNDEFRRIWRDRTFPLVNPLSAAAVIGVFSNGTPWLEELTVYLDANFAYLRDTLAAELPDAVFGVPDATYLAWIDVSKYLGPDVHLTRHFAESAGVMLEGGDMFVADAQGHIRINVACPRAVLEEGLRRIIDAARSSAS